MPRALLLLLALAGPCLGAEPWLRIVTPHFELFTDDTEKAGLGMAAHFEQVRNFFLQVAPAKLAEESPVRLVVFRSHEGFALYSPRPNMAAYYTGNQRGDYIVMQDATPRSSQIAIHEYTHLILRHSGLRVPVWLDEGWADVYSTLHPAKGGIAVGDLLPERMKTLESGPWLDFGTLTSVLRTSPIYNENDRTGMFYAESWALAHMLFLAPDYKQNFAKFVTALHRGSSAADACQSAFGKPAAQVFLDLRSYFDRRKLYGAIFEVRGEAMEAPMEAQPLDEFGTRLAMADLQVALGRFDIAGRELEALEELHHKGPELAASRGYLGLAKKDFVLARMSFRQAYEEGSRDPRLCLALAQMEILDNEPPEWAIPKVERALQAKPDYPEALLQLGLLRVAARRFGPAIETLMSIANVTPERAPRLFIALAYAYLETGDLERSKKNAGTAGKWARLPEDAQRLAQLNTLLEAREKLPAPPRPGEKRQTAEGILQGVECGSGGNRLRLETGGRTLAFLLPDAKAVEFALQKGHTLTLGCGAQEPLPLTVEYAPASVVEKGLAGVVRRLRY